MPGRKAVGIKTASSTRVVAITGPETSLMALMAASLRSMPRSMWATVASTTTMESSTTMPMASTRPKRVSMLIEKPRGSMTASVPMSETGMVTAGIRVARQSCKNRNNTRKTSAIASNRVMNTCLIDASTNMVVS